MAASRVLRTPVPARWLLLLVVAARLVLGAGPAAADIAVEPHSGRLLATVVDMAVPAGPAALTLARVLTPDGTGGRLLGPRWRLNWEIRLVPQGADMVVSDGSGDILLKRQGAAGDYRGPAGERLAVAADGGAALARPDATTDLFDRDGRLVERDLRNGNRIRLRYGPAGGLARIEGPYGSAIDLAADATGRLVRAAAGDGSEARYSYAGDGLASVVDADGVAIRYAYDDRGALTLVDDPRSGAVRIAYDDRRRVTARRFADGSQERFAYDDARHLTRRTDAGGAVTLWQLAEGGREVITDAGGGRTMVESDAAGRPLAIAAPSGLTARFRYDGSGRLVQQAGPDGRATRFDYLGDTGLLAAMTYPDGTRQTVEYDKERNPVAVGLGSRMLAAYAYTADGLVAVVTAADGSRTSYAYDAAGRLAAATDAAGATTRYAYDAHGNPVRETNALGGVTQRDYDAHGRLLGETDPNGAVTRFAYDEAGRLVRLVNPDGTEERYAYDALGRLVGVVGRDGRKAGVELDPAGRPLLRRRSDGLVEQFRYDQAGAVTQAVDAAGRVTRFDYDAAGRLLGERRPTGRTLRYAYDSLGRMIGIDDSASGASRQLWDANGLLAAVVDATGATVRFDYDPSGRIRSIADPLGNQRRFAYDAAGRLVAATMPGGDAARVEYDAGGRSVAIHRPDGTVIRYGRDPLGDVTAIDGPSGPVARHRYDQAGDRIATTDGAGLTTSFAYDAMGNLVRKQLPDGQAVTYRYGPAGELLAVADANFPIEYRYDPQHRLVATTYKAMQRSVLHAYDKDGLLATVTASTGQAIQYRYDAMKRLAAIVLPGGGEIGFAYDGGGRLHQVRYPNGITGTWDYDPTGAVGSLAYVDAAKQTVASWRYGYDPAGNPVAVVRAGRPALSYRYDADGRLVEEGGGAGPPVRYAYRPGGDRASRSAGDVTVAYRYDRGLLVEAGGERLAYDADGNLIGRIGPSAAAAASYAYDSENRLVKAAPANGGTVTFGYAPTGERVWRRDAAGLTWFLHDGDDLLEEIDAAGRSAALYIHGPGIDRPLAMQRGGQTYFYIADALGSIAALTDAKGKVAARYETDAFGRLLGPLPSLPNRFIFTGREYEPALGLYYYRARYYDPALGRFLSADPVLGRPRDPATLNRYVYADNAPTRFRDPRGLSGYDWAITESPASNYRIDYDYWARRYNLNPSVIRQLEHDVARNFADPNYVAGAGNQPVSAGQLRSNAAYIVERALANAAPDFGKLSPEQIVERAGAELAGPVSPPRSFAYTGSQSGGPPSNTVSIGEIFPEGPGAGPSAGNISRIDLTPPGPALGPNGTILNNNAIILNPGEVAGLGPAAGAAPAATQPIPALPGTATEPGIPVPPSATQPIPALPGTATEPGIPVPSPAAPPAATQPIPALPGTATQPGIPAVPPAPPPGGPPPAAAGAASPAPPAGPAAAPAPAPGVTPSQIFAGAAASGVLGASAAAANCYAADGTARQCATSAVVGGTLGAGATMATNYVNAVSAVGGQLAASSPTAASVLRFVGGRAVPVVGGALVYVSTARNLYAATQQLVFAGQAVGGQLAAEQQAAALLSSEAGVNQVIGIADARIVQLRALRDSINEGLKSLGQDIDQAKSTTEAVKELLDLPGKGVTLEGPRVVPGVDSEGLGAGCTQAKSALDSLESQSTAFTQQARQIADTIGTALDPPESTAAMQKAATGIANLLPKLRQAERTGNELKKALAKLREGFKSLATGDQELQEREKAATDLIDGYSGKLDAIQAKVAALTAQVRSFDQQKDDIRGYLARMRAAAAPEGALAILRTNYQGRFDAPIGELEAVTLPGDVEAKLAEPGDLLFASNKLIPDARAAVKSAYDALRDPRKAEQDKCEVLKGITPDQLADRGKQALQSMADDVEAITFVYLSRQQRLQKDMEIGNDTLEIVKRKLPDAEQKHDEATRQKLEHDRDETKKLMEATKNEQKVLDDGKPNVTSASQAGNSLGLLGQTMGE
jgi:RHS repeat-associated protein